MFYHYTWPLVKKFCVLFEKIRKCLPFHEYCNWLTSAIKNIHPLSTDRRWRAGVWESLSPLSLPGGWRVVLRLGSDPLSGPWFPPFVARPTQSRCRASSLMATVNRFVGCCVGVGGNWLVSISLDREAVGGGVSSVDDMSKIKNKQNIPPPVIALVNLSIYFLSVGP